MVNCKSSLISLLFLLGLCLFVSCNQDEKKAAEQLLIAKEYAQKQNFEAARLLIDSIKLVYPNASNAIQEGQVLEWEMEVKEMKDSILQLDTLLTEYQQKADSLKRNLLFEKDEIYQTEGFYMTKDQTLEKTMGRSCLRFFVTESGNISVQAVVSGKGRGTFSSVKAETGTGIWGSTPELSKDDGNNYSGEVSQTLKFTGGKDNGFIEFLYTYKNEPLTISFLGSTKSSYTYKFSKTEKQALEQMYELSMALSEQNRIRFEQKMIEAKIILTNEAMGKYNQLMSRE